MTDAAEGAVGRRDQGLGPLKENGEPGLGGRSTHGDLATGRDLVAVDAQQPREFADVRREDRARGGAAREVERPGVEHERRAAANASLDKRHLAPLARLARLAILARSDDPYGGSPGRRHHLGSPLQHEAGRAARTAVAHHPDPGAQRRLDAEHRGPG